MTNNILRLIDNHVTYRFSGFIIYFYFLFSQMISVRETDNPVFPNIISFILINVILFNLTILSQIIEPINYPRNWIIKRLTLAAIPPLLGLVLSIQFYREEKRKQRDIVFEYMAIIIGILMSMLTFSYIILLALLYAYSEITILSFYFLSLGILGFLGISLADSGILYSSEINYRNNERSPKQKLQHHCSLLFSKYLASAKQRITALTIQLVILGILVMWNNVFGNYPISL